MKSKTYFQAPGDYFWQWYDNGAKIIWMNGETVCTRDELIEILGSLSNKGLPPLSPVLMLLLACKKELHVQEKFFLIRTVFKFKEPWLEQLYNEAITFMQLIYELPYELRSGDNRILLMRAVFFSEGDILSETESVDVINGLKHDSTGVILMERGPEVTKEEVSAHLMYLSNALKIYNSVQKIELMLGT